MQWKNTSSYYGMVSRVFHWLSAIAVFGLFALGLWMTELTYYDTWYTKAPAFHKGVGIMLFILTLLRIVWITNNKKPTPLPNQPQWELKSAKFVHLLLYVFLILVMVSGYLISTADGRPINVFGLFEVPAIVYGIDQQEDAAGVVHKFLAFALIIFAVFHAIAALKHHFIDKDETMARMLGRTSN